VGRGENDTLDEKHAVVRHGAPSIHALELALTHAARRWAGDLELASAKHQKIKSKLPRRSTRRG
jgi:hypothetical protein